MATLEEALFGLGSTPMDTGYGIAAQQVGQLGPQLINPYGSTGQAIGIGLGTILLQSLLGYQARSQAAQETLQLNTLANQMQELATPQARIDFISGLSDPLQQSRLSTLATALTAQEQARKAKAAEKLLDLETGAQFQTSEQGIALANELARREGEKEIAALKAVSNYLGSPEGEPALEAQRALSRAKGAGVTERIENIQNQIAERQRKGFEQPTGAQYKTATDSARLANNLQTLENEIKDLSYAEIKTMIATGISPKGKPGLAARFEQIQQMYRNPEFGATLTGNELSSSEIVFGKNLAATKEDMLAALKFLSNSQYDKAELTLGAKQIGPEQMLENIRQARTTGQLSFAPQTTQPVEQQSVQRSGAEFMSNLKTKYGADWKTKLTDTERTTLKALVDAAKGQ